jgi:1,4-alpha-glucan branching enzyme
MRTRRHDAAGALADVTAELALVAAGRHADPHRVLGAHVVDGHVMVRAWLPGARRCTVRPAEGPAVAAEPVATARGAFIADLGPDHEVPPAYRLAVEWESGEEAEVEDPYRFWPTLGELDLHLWGEGRHQAPWRRLGARLITHDGVLGTAFAVWAPSARSVRVVGEWNFWDGRVHPMRVLGSSGVWELFVPAARRGQLYKFEILGANGELLLKADPFAAATEAPPGTASRIFASDYVWRDDAWVTARSTTDPLRPRMAVYECHLGSWRRGEDNTVLGYRDLAGLLPEYLEEMGFTHVEMMPVAEHPFGGSWGYQVSSYFAPSARYGTPDDFRFLVDALHQRGIGVIVDWVPAHFPRDIWALARFDGSALFEHADPRQGEHPDWGTLVFNFGRREVRNFLTASALHWIDEFHIDGLRVDAVASMLYLDYSRPPGGWVPNKFGGRENLDAIELLREVNIAVHGRYTGAFTVAEESTAWPAVSRPVYTGGLGFTFKWNMGWMHDTLDYFGRDPVHRRYHHNELTFGLWYAFNENFVLPLSHDEVVHGKGSLLGRMPGDRWQQFANLRALFGWMWAHPGRPLLFMGGEFGQEREWSHEYSLDWHLLRDPLHAGVQTLVRSLNIVAARYPCLWEKDFEPAGFSWIEGNDADHNILAFLRLSAEGDPVAVVANLAPVVRSGWPLGLPEAGPWDEVLTTDAVEFGGSGVTNGRVEAQAVPAHGRPYSARLTLPPLGVTWLVPARVAAGDAPPRVTPARAAPDSGVR